MLIHIGAGYLVREKDIVGYFDIDGKVDSAITNDFLKKAEKNGQCDTAGEDLPRSFVLTSPPSLRKNGAAKQNPAKKISSDKIVHSAGDMHNNTLNMHKNNIGGGKSAENSRVESGRKDKVILTHISTQALKKR